MEEDDEETQIKEDKEEQKSLKVSDLNNMEYVQKHAELELDLRKLKANVHFEDIDKT